MAILPLIFLLFINIKHIIAININVSASPNLVIAFIINVIKSDFNDIITLYILISKVIGYERCLYCDTDSIFYISDDETEKRIEAFNEERRTTAHFVELENGKREYYDEFTLEPDCLAFKGLHSKCYGVVTEKGLEITIAGVPARTLIGMNDGQPGYFTREQEQDKKPY